MISAPIMVWICYAVALLFAVAGAVPNALGPPFLVEGYRRWGYPPWWRFVTAALDLIGAVLLLFSETRLFGALLLAGVCAAAIATLIWHGENKHAVAPGALLLIALIPIIPLSGGGSP